MAQRRRPKEAKIHKSPNVFSPEYLESIELVSHLQGKEEVEGSHIRDVQEAIFVLVLFVNAAHQSGGGRKDFIHEDEDSLLRRELYAFADDIDELAHGEISRDKILLLIDGSDVRLLDLLADDL